MFITLPFWTIPMIRQGSDFPVVWAVRPAWTPCSGEHPACRHAPQPLQVRPQSLPTYPSGPAPVHTALGDSGLALKSLFVPSCFLKGGCAPGCIMMATVQGQGMGFGHGQPSCAWVQRPSLKGKAVAKGSVDWTQPGPTQEPRLLCWDLFHHSGRCCQASLPPT